MKCSALFHAVFATAISVSLFGPVLARQGTKMGPNAKTMTIEGAVREANRHLGPNQRIAGWRLWPETDFPRTHTLKVKRDAIRTWAAVEAPLPVRPN